MTQGCSPLFPPVPVGPTPHCEPQKLNTVRTGSRLSTLTLHLLVLLSFSKLQFGFPVRHFGKLKCLSSSVIIYFVAVGQLVTSLHGKDSPLLRESEPCRRQTAGTLAQVLGVHARHSCSSQDTKCHPNPLITCLYKAQAFGLICSHGIKAGVLQL